MNSRRFIRSPRRRGRAARANVSLCPSGSGIYPDEADPRSSSGNFAKFTASRRASSLVSKLAAARWPRIFIRGRIAVQLFVKSEGKINGNLEATK